LSIFYRTIGQSSCPKKVLLLHGWSPLGGVNWQKFLDLFDAKEYQVIAPDLPGMGQSPDPQGVWNSLDYAKFFLEFASRNLAWDKYFLVGHSFGGAIASQMCSMSKNPQKLALLAPAIVREGLNSKQKKIVKTTKWGKKIFQIPVFRPFWGLAKKAWYKAFGCSDYTQVSQLMKQVHQKVVKEDLQYLLPKINQPSLIIWGDKDTITPLRYSQIISQGLANSQLKIFAGTNHGLHIHATDKLYAEILNFLEK
jgi:pimeloyl-ACP methyl ester carboxylesterase